MKKWFLKDCHDEYFEIHLNIENDRLSIKDLRTLLLKIEKLIYSIYQTISDWYEFDENVLYIDVLNHENGCFKIPMSIKSLLHNATDDFTVGSLIGSLFMSTIGSSFLEHENSNIDSRELFENLETVKLVKDIAKLVVENDRISDVSITYEKDDDSRDTITVSRQQFADLKEFMSLIVEKDNVEALAEWLGQRSVATLGIVSPAFETCYSNWTVRYDGKIVEAKMLDTDFLKQINTDGFVFRKGDALEAEIIIDNQYSNPRYYIVEVIKYLHFGK